VSVFVVGLNHKTAAISLRERFLIPAEREEEFIGLVELGAPLSEKTLLSTCNRTELYGVAEDTARVYCASLSAFERFTGLSRDEFGDKLYFKTGEETVSHLFSVAGGLDSLALGETEILGQVKTAYQRAHAHRLTGGVLNRLFQRSLSVAKKLRTQTEIGVGKVSVASISIDLAKKIFDDLSEKHILLIGSGDVARQVCEALVPRGVKHIRIANRSADKAEELARTFGGSAIPYDQIDEFMPETDILISSVSTPDPIVGPERARGWMHVKKGRSLFLIDLGVPRNIDPRAGDVDGAYLYNLDDLKSIAERNFAARESAAASCREIIALAAVAFMSRIELSSGFETV